MALSQRSQKILVQETSKPLAAALQAAITGRSALAAKDQVRLASYLASQLSSKAKRPTAAAEIVAAVVSGAALSLNAKRHILIMMADAKAGNELINNIQSAATAAIKL